MLNNMILKAPFIALSMLTYWFMAYFGVPGTPAAAHSISPVSIDFGTVQVGVEVSHIVHLSSGNNPLDIAFGSLAAPFRYETACPSSLPVDSSCDVTVFFKPAAVGGPYSADLTVTGTNLKVALSGSGADVLITHSASPAVIDHKDPYTYTLELKSNGAIPAPGVGITDTLPTGVDFIKFTSDSDPAASFNLAAKQVTWQGDVDSTGKTIKFVVQHTGDYGQTLTDMVTISTDPAVSSQTNVRVKTVPRLSFEAGVGTFVEPQILGIASPWKNIPVTNSGESILVMNPPTITGPFEIDFSGCQGQSLDKDKTCTFKARYVPAQPNAEPGKLTFTYGDEGQLTTDVPLSGTGRKPALTITKQVAKPAIDYHATNTYTITLTNNETSVDLDVSIEDDVPSDLVVKSALANLNPAVGIVNNKVTWQGTLARQSGVKITIQVAHQGIHSGIISNTASYIYKTITESGGAVPFVVRSPAQVSLNPISLDYGLQLVNTSRPLTISVENTGQSLLTITHQIDSEFSVVSNTCQAVVSKGQCSLAVAFLPVAEVPYAGSLTLSVNEQSAPVVVGLTGTGALPHLSLTQAIERSSNNNAYPPSGTITHTLTLVNSGKIMATNVTMQDEFDPAMKFVRWSDAPVGTKKEFPTMVTWNGNIGANTTHTFRFVSTYTSVCGDTLTNKASYIYGGQPVYAQEVTFTTPKCLFLPVAVIQKDLSVNNGDFSQNLTSWKVSGGPVSVNSVTYGSGLSSLIASVQADGFGQGIVAQLGRSGLENYKIPVGYGALSQQMTVKGNYLSFDYKLIGYDWLKYNSGAYQDSLEVAAFTKEPASLTSIFSQAQRNAVCKRTSEITNVWTAEVILDGLAWCVGSPGPQGTYAEYPGKGVLHFTNDQVDKTIWLYFILWEREYFKPYYNDQGFYNTWVQIDNVRWSSSAP